MGRRLLITVMISIIPVTYLATLDLVSALVTAIAVTISNLGSGVLQSHLSSRSTTQEMHQKLSRSVSALVDRDLESEIFKLSSQVEEKIKTELHSIDSEEELGQKSFKLAVFFPVLIFLLNALFLFVISKDSILRNDETVLGIGSMLILAHLSPLTPNHWPRNS